MKKTTEGLLRCALFNVRAHLRVRPWYLWAIISLFAIGLASYVWWKWSGRYHLVSLDRSAEISDFFWSVAPADSLEFCIPAGDSDPVVLKRVADPLEVAEFLKILRFPVYQLSFPCMCEGDLIIRFLDDDKLLEEASWHHGLSLHFRKNKLRVPPCDWPYERYINGNAELTPESTLLLSSWLRRHGILSKSFQIENRYRLIDTTVERLVQMPELENEGFGPWVSFQCYGDWSMDLWFWRSEFQGDAFQNREQLYRLFGWREGSTAVWLRHVSRLTPDHLYFPIKENDETMLTQVWDRLARQAPVWYDGYPLNSKTNAMAPDAEFWLRKTRCWIIENSSEVMLERFREAGLDFDHACEEKQ